MPETIIAGGLLRFVQALGQAAPTILVGLIVTGIFRRLLGQQNTLRVFGNNGWRSLPQAWALGMLLPVCSLGVIPILREMRRSGVGGGAILAFALAAPLFNPLSLLYGLTLSKPYVIVAFAFCSLAIVTIIGSLWDRLFPNSAAAEAPPRPARQGLKRMLAILLVTVREAAGPSLGYILIGLSGTAVLAALLSPGALERSMNGDNPWAPWTMTWVAIPAYATPMLAMSQLGAMFQHANSPGAAFALLTLGAGMNLGSLAWMTAHFGWKRSAVWFGLLVTVVLGLAYAINGPLLPTEVDPADHTHAFDVYCNPFRPSQNLAADAEFRFRSIPLLDWCGMAILGTVVLAGLILRKVDSAGRIESWLESDAESAAVPSRWDVTVPAPVLGVVALIGLVAFSIVGCFAYYPSRQEVFEEMKAVRAEALYFAKQKDSKRTDHWFALWDDWTRKLEVGVYLRTGRLSEYQHMKARIFREKLEQLRHAVEDQDDEEIKECVSGVYHADRRLQVAFSDP